MTLYRRLIGRHVLAAATVLVGAMLLADLANAQTVAEIKASGTLKVGSQVAQVPWGFYESDGKLTGFDI